ncbi:MAG: hypothetical protein K6E75_02290 [Lachnospiraceae bacterium]|nr:hypothetical protein [Lachnospiraceae bacterium]
MDWKDELRKTIYGQLTEEEQSRYKDSLYQTGEARSAQNLDAFQKSGGAGAAETAPIWEKTAAAAEEEVFFSEDDIVSAVRAIANLAEASEKEREKNKQPAKNEPEPVPDPEPEQSPETENAIGEKLFSAAVEEESGDRIPPVIEAGISPAVREWLYKENLRLEGLREEVARAGRLMQKQAALLKEEEKRLQTEREAFEKEKEEFKKEMKGWNEQIRQSKQKLAEEQGLFDKKYKVLEMGFAKLNSDKKELEAQKRAFEFRKQFLSDAETFASLDSGKGIQSSEFIFFKGATHPLAVKKRYKELIKIYHPDNMDGDKMILQRINQEYDRLRRLQQ